MEGTENPLFVGGTPPRTSTYELELEPEPEPEPEPEREPEPEPDSMTRHYVSGMSEPTIAATYGLTGSVYKEQIAEPEHTGYTPRLYPRGVTKTKAKAAAKAKAKRVSIAPPAAGPLSPISSNAAAARNRVAPADKPKDDLGTVKEEQGDGRASARARKSKSARKRARRKKAKAKAQRLGSGIATPRDLVAPSPA